MQWMSCTCLFSLTQTLLLPQFQICTSPLSSFMHCPTPDLRHVDLSLVDKLEFDFGFVMDGVESLLRIQKENFGFKQLRYVHDPYIAKFKSPVAYILGKPLKIYVSKNH